MNTLTDTLWNNFNKRHQWIFDAADKIRAQDRAMPSARAGRQSPSQSSLSRPDGRPSLSQGRREMTTPDSLWRRDALPFDKRPSRQFVWLSGERYHSGMLWRRDWWGVAFIRPDDADDGRLGYRAEDIDRLEREGDMDCGTAEIYGWLPACTPAYFNMEQRDAISVNAASADTRPEGGDSTKIEAPFTGGAVPHEDAADAQ